MNRLAITSIILTRNCTDMPMEPKLPVAAAAAAAAGSVAEVPVVPVLATFFTLNVQTFLVVLLVFFVVFNLVQQARAPVNLPPGPRGYPIVGVLPRLANPPAYLTFQRWWHEYGDVYSCYMGSRLVVIINGVDAMRECLVKKADTFNARPWNYFKKLTRNKGIVFTDGEVWKEHRRFTLSSLRDLGMGKVSLEQTIHEELGYLTTEFLREEEKPFPVTKHLTKAIANIICKITYGTRFDYTDDVFDANIKALDQSVRHQTMIGMIQFLPFLEFLPKILPTDKLMQKNVRNREKFAQEQLDWHKDNLQINSPRDFIDSYLIKMQEANGNNNSTFHDSQLLRTIQDLFIAGTETLNTTLKWAYLFMALHPEIQEKVQHEIDTVIGRGRRVTLKDKPLMPYTEATIMECQRLGNIALFSVPRCATADTTLSGYNIPEGAWIFVNRWGVHASPKYWYKPETFDPTRFLDKEGNVFKPDAFIPFGIGPRSCLGESLAKMELFLFFTSTLQHFKLMLPKGVPVPSLEPQPGINMSPQPYMLAMQQR